VHEDHATPTLGAERGHLGVGEAGDVVDDRSARIQGRGSDRRLVGVDRHGGPGRRRGPHDGNDPLDLLLGRHRRPVGNVRFAADLDQVSARGEPLRDAIGGSRRRPILTLVGERVRRGVDDRDD
jgi:hypothetical protein